MLQWWVQFHSILFSFRVHGRQVHTSLFFVLIDLVQAIRGQKEAAEVTTIVSLRLF